MAFPPVFVQAVLRKEFVGAKSDKLLGTGKPTGRTRSIFFV